MSPRSYILALTMLAWATPGHAAPLQASLAADRTQLQAGQSVLVAVRVRGGDTMPEVAPPSVPGCPIQLVNQGQASSSLMQGLPSGQNLAQALRDMNKGPGALSPDMQKALQDSGLFKEYQDALKALQDLHQKEYVFNYRVQPSGTGTWILPPFKATSGAESASTQPLTLLVRNTSAEKSSQQASTHAVRALLSLSNPSPQVGEEIQLYIDIMVPRANVVVTNKRFPFLPFKDTHLSMPTLENQQQVEWTRPFEQIMKDNAPPEGRAGIRVNQLPGEVALEYEAPGENPDPGYYRRRLTLPLRARHAGKIEMPAIKVSGDIFADTSAGGLARVTASKSSWQSFVAESAPLSFQVFDLDSRPDRPADFSGLIGDVHLSSKASQTNLAVGTPFTLTLRLEGKGSLGKARPPALEQTPEFTQSYRVRAEADQFTPDKAREFLYTLRPLSEAASVIPAVALSYFNPKSDRFETLRTEPITLHVVPAALANAESPSVPANPSAGSMAAPSWAERARTILPWAAGGCAALLLFYLAGKVFRRLRQAQPKSVDEERRPMTPLVSAPPVPATPVLARVHPVDGIRAQFSDFLRSRFGLPPGEVTPLDAHDCLVRAEVGDSLAQQAADLLHTCAAATFASGAVAVDLGELGASARRLMVELDQKLRAKSGSVSRGFLRGPKRVGRKAPQPALHR